MGIEGYRAYGKKVYIYDLRVLRIHPSEHGECALGAAITFLLGTDVPVAKFLSGMDMSSLSGTTRHEKRDILKIVMNVL